jgi:hypothetical protein
VAVALLEAIALWGDPAENLTLAREPGAAAVAALVSPV